ncbi:hypothetical protein OAK52_01495 [Chloroflexi bacterium]|nr:hypothetical protein [Chloroflexota bacterium]
MSTFEHYNYLTMNLWDKNTEICFFEKEIEKSINPNKLFYKIHDDYFAYFPKNIQAQGQTMQSRNSLIGKFTEKWVQNLLNPIAKNLGLYAVNNVVCPEIGMSNMSDADLVFSTTNTRQQKAENIKIIFEIKMSIVNNYQYLDNKIKFIGDYKSHKGVPSILRSDSVLKAIGKSLNVRISGDSSRKIPIIILGNSPVTKNYTHKIDFLKKSGVIQSFISLYPNPTDDYIKNSPNKGFQTFFDYESLKEFLSDIIYSDIYFFSSMIDKKKLADIISVSSKEKDKNKISDKFISLLGS